MRSSWLAAVALAAAPAMAQADVVQSPRAIVEAAVEAHGGDGWLEPRTLVLEGRAVFYAPDSAEPRDTADDYRMWRQIDAGRRTAHGAEGKVRIVARSGDRLIFEVGYDGENTWTERGIMPKEQADAYWASNFGFGIVRSALDEGFMLEAAPAREIGGHPIDLVRIVDPQGAATLFGFDRESRFIRYMGFRTPRGWHERVYDDFVRLPESGWVQARSVTLFYDGVRANSVLWTRTTVGEPIAPEIFEPPREPPAQTARLPGQQAAD